MTEPLKSLFDRIQELEADLIREFNRKEAEFRYEVHQKKVRFQTMIRGEHQRMAKGLVRYLLDAPLISYLTAPAAWLCLFPALLLDLTVAFYQAVCFPAWEVPRVRRGDYVIIDRHSLAYLNPIEKLNCVYCGYFTGLMEYVREVAARTEQHWCPIKHARRIRAGHSRYKYFFDYGDALRYRHEFTSVRRRYDHLEPVAPEPPSSDAPNP